MKPKQLKMNKERMSVERINVLLQLSDCAFVGGPKSGQHENIADDCNLYRCYEEKLGDGRGMLCTALYFRDGRTNDFFWLPEPYPITTAPQS